MPDAPKPDPVVGKTIRFTWDGGPTKGETHEHVFNADGSVDYHKVGGEPRKGKPMHEKKYGAVKVTDKVCVVSYRGSSGYTLTVVLNSDDNRIAGFVSNEKDWLPLTGRFEVVK